MTRDRLDAPTAASEKPDPARERALGGIYAFAAYFLWGFMPLYFLLLRPIGPFELVAWRILLSLAFCVILLTVLRGWGRLLTIVRQPRLLMWTALAGGLIYINWQVFIVAALTGHIIETSLGYFMNPIVTVLLGVLLLRERLRVTQWVALGLAAAAVGGHHRRIRRVPVDRAQPRVLVRPVRLRQEAHRPLGRCGERPDTRVRLARAGRRHPAGRGRLDDGLGDGPERCGATPFC